MKLSILALAFCVGAISSANLITNGGFENPVVPVGGYTTYTNGSTDITGWTVVGTQVLLLEGSYSEPSNGMSMFQSQEGVQYLDLTGAGNQGLTSGVTQSIATVAGQADTVKWYQANSLSANQHPAYQAASTVDFSIDGGTTRSPFTFLGTTYGSNEWALMSTDFVATGSTTSISFFNGYAGGDNNNIGIDNVSVEAVPEPATLAALGLGIAALKRRRK